MNKSPDAFRTISEVADWLGVQPHVLRFWESKFTQVKPVKRAGGRRYYRPADMQLLGGIRKLLHEDGLTIKGAQKILREEGMAHVASLSQPLEVDEAETITAEAAPATPEPAEDTHIVSPFDGADVEPASAPEPSLAQDMPMASEAAAAPEVSPAPDAPTSDAASLPSFLTGAAEPMETQYAPEDTPEAAETAADEAPMAVDVPPEEPHAPAEPASLFSAFEPEPPSAAAVPEIDPEPISQTPAPEAGVGMSAPEADPTPSAEEPSNLPSFLVNLQEEAAEKAAELVPEADSVPEPDVAPEASTAPEPETAPHPDTTPDPEPLVLEPQQAVDPRPRIVDAPDPPADSDLPARPAALSAAFAARGLSAAQRADLTPLVAQLAALRDRLATKHGRGA